jgi:hypothetical protein
MRILGLDTGTTQTGYCLLNCDGDTIDIITSGKAENNEIFNIIKECDLSDGSRRSSDGSRNLMALEVIRFQDKHKVGNEVFITSQWVGRFMQHGINYGIKDVLEVSKKQHGDYHENRCWREHSKLFKGNSDSKLRQALQMLYPSFKILSNDARNALSVALYCNDVERR